MGARRRPRSPSPAAADQRRGQSSRACPPGTAAGPATAASLLAAIKSEEMGRRNCKHDPGAGRLTQL